MTETRLTLPQELMLLGWDDQKGRNRYISNLPMLLAGATILELVLQDRLEVSDGRLEVVGTTTGEPALDLALERIRNSRKARTTKTWVQRLGNRRELRQQTRRRLVDQGVLGEEEQRLLGLIPITRHPVIDAGRADRVRRRVTEALTQTEAVADARDAALASLVHPGGWGLLRRLVPKEQRTAARKRAKALTKGEAMSEDIAKAIGEANAAAMAAVGAAAAASSSSSSGS